MLHHTGSHANANDVFFLWQAEADKDILDTGSKASWILCSWKTFRVLSRISFFSYGMLLLFCVISLFFGNS